MQLPNLPTNKFKEQDIIDLVNSNNNPVSISFNSPYDDNLIITVPVWTYFFNEKFYVFTGENSLKVKAIKKGLTNFSLIIIDKNSFPVVYSSKMPYFSISGEATIISQTENSNINEIHIKLLKKYNYEGAPKWLEKMILKLNEGPKNTWLIEIRPKKVFIFNE